ncbi:hypothetical protein AB4120_26100, partial [Cupriavidus sp. 2KB_3]
MAQADEMDGVRVVMSAPQLAAVLAHRSISPSEMMSNCIWGGWDIVGGVLEMVWTGHDTATLTQQGAAKLAETMRAPPDMAGNIGLSLDIGVGFGLAGMLK